jgi:hypothetical protein
MQTIFKVLFFEATSTLGLYRIVWRGKDFETLPVEFRVSEDPF